MFKGGGDYSSFVLTEATRRLRPNTVQNESFCHGPVAFEICRCEVNHDHCLTAVLYYLYSHVDSI